MRGRLRGSRHGGRLGGDASRVGRRARRPASSLRKRPGPSCKGWGGRVLVSSGDVGALEAAAESGVRVRVVEDLKGLVGVNDEFERVACVFEDGDGK